jgi:hypothetical protein
MDEHTSHSGGRGGPGEPHDHVWVEVEVQKGSLVSVYRGRLRRVDLERWERGELVRGAIVLDQVYWSYDERDGNEGWVVLGATPGPYAQAAGKAYLRADCILVVLPLRDGSEREAHILRPRSSSNIDA